MDDRSYRAALERLESLARRAGIPFSELIEHLDLLQEIRSYEADRPDEPSGLPGNWLHRRIAIVSDIHGNWVGLQRIIDDYWSRGCSQVICLGDLVDGGPDDEAVVRWAIDNAVITVRGNHDEFTEHLELSEKAKGFLEHLPSRLVVEDIVFTHISPRDAQRKIRDPCEAWNVFDETPFRLAFVGHAHVSYIYGEKSSEPVTAKEHRFEFNRPFELDPDDRYLISVGSAGYPREPPRTLRYGILDLDAKTVELRSVDGPVLPLGIPGGAHR